MQHEDFNVADEMARMRDARRDIGALVSFCGLVRDLNQQAAITGLSLEHYPGMTEKQLADIVEQAENRWRLQDVTVIHRVGQLAPGDQIVMVVTASMHRADAYEANQFIMDYLKTRATFWKKETTTNNSRWVDSRDSDAAAADRWKTTS